MVVAVIALLLAILLPSLRQAKASARGAACLSRLRQFALAAQSYTQGNGERYPISYYSVVTATGSFQYAWDYTVVIDWTSGTRRLEPGLLWQQSRAPMEIHQCPSFAGKPNWAGERFTGYNYNTSYVGHGALESIPEPARASDVRRPGACALFGDGEWSEGANKFMRAPWSNPGDESFSGGRFSGTQGYRHQKKTNVAFCDGHAEARRERHVKTYEAERDRIAAGTGFLSKDNSAYDLE